MALEIDEATETDFPRIMDIKFSSFGGDPLHTVLHGPNTAENRAAAARRAVKEWQSDPYQVTIKATKKDTGEIVAFGRWEIYKTERLESEWKKRGACDWLEGRRREIAERFYGMFEEGRERLGLGGRIAVCF